ncbi:hypothetical protein [Pseudoalteromonas sp. Ps84H-4]|uniref:hypothetical protein n=1 Tax=Pseudoalteromonas sp. Ps84H-4 TaxID=2954502 RepID=UPI0020982222|nr:hypothetical protein [Pseudoalteromonas sp. Ps84H-4]MCO7251252.1 hypothetical protein [Pseudoalteromonas sp. Ps84H-4]
MSNTTEQLSKGNVLNAIATQYHVLLKEQTQQRFNWLKQQSCEHQIPFEALSSVCNFLNDDENPLIDDERLSELVIAMDRLFNSPLFKNAKTSTNTELAIKQLIYLLSAYVTEQVVTCNTIESLLIRGHIQQARESVLLNLIKEKNHDE